MPIYKLQKVRNEEGGQLDSKGKKVLHYRGASNRIACGQNEYGALTGLTKEQEKYYEQALHLKEGTLNRNSEFWHTWNVAIDAAGKRFNDEEPKDALDILVLKQRKIIGYTLEDGKNPDVQYILTSEDHDAKVAIDTRTYKKKAFAFLDKMSEEDMANYLIATNKKITGLSKDQIEALVGEEAELNPKRFLEIAQDEDKDLIVFINELVQNGIYTRKASAYVDKQSGDTIGFRLDSVVDYFKDPENQAYYVTLQKDLAKKKKAK